MLIQENIRGIEEVCKGKDEVIASVKQEIETQMRALSEAKTRINSLEEELASLKNELIENMQQIHSLNEQIRKLQVRIPVSVYTFNIHDIFVFYMHCLINVVTRHTTQTCAYEGLLHF